VTLDRVGLASGLDAAGVSWRELDDAGRQTYAVDGVEPFAICWPDTAEEASQCLSVADRLGVSVSPRGSGTKVGLGNKPRSCDLIVSTDRLQRIVDYAPENLTVTVEAGLRLSALQSMLASDHQNLPIDPPNAPRATLGGIMAANANGARRLGYGSLRDLVIGTRSVTPSGTIVRSGGRVVKNVAGYDLGKLYIGSLGTLVLLIEVNLKVTPVPSSQSTTVGNFESLERVAKLSRSIARSPLMPLALDVFNAPAAAALTNRIAGLVPTRQTGYLLMVLGAAPGGGVHRQAADFARLFEQAGATDIVQLETADSDRLWSGVNAIGDSDDRNDRIQLKISVPPGRLLEVWNLLEAYVEDLGGNPSISGRAASGVFYVAWSPLGGALDGALANTAVRIEEIRRQVVGLGGSLVVEQCPVSMKNHLDVWGDVGSSLPVMKRLKSALDPRGIMNPGRFVGGI
jgi:glycolate oxidase FAD binding subunit